MSEPLALELRGMRKSFGGAVALRDGSLAVRPATIHGIVGPNGAGKSTLTRIASGQIVPDDGQLRVGGERRRFRVPADSLAAGIASMPQELTVVADLSVQENVVVGREPARAGVVRRAARRRAARELLERIGVDLPLDAPTGSLTPADQRVVMLARALHSGARVLFLDEPTAALSRAQAERFLTVVEAVRAHGVAVVYVSHRFGEVERLCDEVTVLRDGRTVRTLAGPEVTATALVQAVVNEGALAQPASRGTRRAGGDVVLSVRGLAGDRVRGVDLDVRAGEIVGVCGLPGAGVDELLELLGGAARAADGTVTARGAARPLRSPADALARGIAYLPSERARAGLLDLPIRQNLLVSRLGDVARAGFLTARAERRAAAEPLDRVGLRRRMDEPLRTLSGGNRQKVLLERCLQTDARVLVLADPSVGVDVGARGDIHELLGAIAAQGRAVVVSSSEPEELAAIADRVLVLVRGEVAATLEGDAVEQQAILRAVTVEPAVASSSAGTAGA